MLIRTAYRISLKTGCIKPDGNACYLDDDENGGSCTISPIDTII